MHCAAVADWQRSCTLRTQTVDDVLYESDVINKRPLLGSSLSFLEAIQADPNNQ